MTKGKKKTINSVKQKALKRAKLSKSGKPKDVRCKNKSFHQRKKKNDTPNLPPENPDAQLLSYLNYGISGDGNDSDLEQQYEKAVAQIQMREKRTKHLLPIKTKNGWIHRSVEEDLTETAEGGDQSDLEQYDEKSAATTQVHGKRTKRLLRNKTNDGSMDQSVEEDLTEEMTQAEESKQTSKKKKEKQKQKEEDVDSDMELIKEVENDFNIEVNPDRPISTAELLGTRETLLRKRKLVIGVLASGVLEEPQQKFDNLKILLNMMEEQMPELQITVCKLATVSLLEVFKDIIPSYQISHKEVSDVRLKKETFKLQAYEKALLRYYKYFLQNLEKLVSVLDKKRKCKASQQEIRLAELALHSMCELLVTHPHFNFSENIVQLVVPYLNHHMSGIREICAKYIHALLKSDKKGVISLHVVRCINHVVKSRSHQVYAEVLKVLLSLNIKEINLEKEVEEELKQKALDKHKKRLISMSRSERKRKKQLQSLERELQETKAQENKESKQKCLTEVTKFVFTIYFRVLKKAPSSKILDVTLEGLARFAHCINLEFYEDIVNVLKQLLDNEPLGYREKLHCVKTVFAILSGHGATLNIDPQQFYVHLYCNLFSVHAGSTHSDALLILQILDTALIKRRRKMSQHRVYAFTKRLATVAMQLLHNGSLGCLAVIKSIMQLNRSVDILLDTDTSVGQGIYYPELEEPEYSNASCTALWELIALKRHYHPVVRKFAQNILHGVPATGEGSIPSEFGKLKPEELFLEFDPSEMVFKPTVPTPKKVVPKSRPSSHFHFKDEDLADYVKQITEKPTEGPLDFSQILFATNT